MVQIVAVLNSKGGSGKTSAAVNLAAALGEGRRRVLLVDLDSQASASTWLGTPGGQDGLMEVLQGAGMLPILETTAPGVDLVPADPRLEGAGERGLAAPVAAQNLRLALANLPARWDIILLDTPPTMNALTFAALAAAGHALIPAEASAMALAGVRATVATIAEAHDEFNENLNLIGILPCRVDARTALSRAVLFALGAEFGRLVFKAAIRESVRLRTAPFHMKPITIYAPGSPAAADFRAAAAELRRRLSR
jgi:chromosome partitioning protein